MNFAVLALIIANMIWGAAPPIFKLALENIPPFTLAFIRFFGAALIFLPPALVSWKKLSIPTFLEICFAGFLGVFLHIAFFFLGLERGESINAGIIATAGPLFLFILAVIFLREKPEKKVLKGMIIAFLGVLCVVLSPLFMGEQVGASQDILANLLYVGATICLVLSTVLAKKILKTVNRYQFVMIVFASSSLCFLPVAVYELQTWSFDMLDGRGILGIFFGLFISSAIAYYLYFWGTSKIKAQEIGIFAYMDPVMTVLVAMPLLGEYPTPVFIFGAFLVFLGIFIAEGRVHWHPLHKLRKD